MSSLRSAVVVAVLVVFATCAVGATASRQQAQAGPTYKQVGSWGKMGKGNGQFLANAFGLATDKAGNVYVADSDNHRIQVFTSKGGFKFKIAFAASEAVQDVAVDAAGNIWGTALQANQARRFPPGGGASTASATTPKSAIGIGADADGNVYVSTAGDTTAAVVRFDKSTDFAAGKTWGGFRAPGDVEVSPDGSVYVVDALSVKRFDATGKLVKTFRGGASSPIGIGIDPDCNLWMTNIAQRNVSKFSPTGKPLATATSGDLIGQDVAVGPTGDLYVFNSGNSSVVHFAEDRSKPGAAAVAQAVVVSHGVAKVKYTLTGVACPAQISAVASLSGAVKGKAVVKVAAGRTTVISIPAKGASGKAQFKIVLKTNGRPTTQTASVNVTVR